MASRGKKIWLAVGILALVLFISNYSYLDSKLENYLTGYERANVSRIVDGDTIEISGGEDVRLLGMDTPERGEEFYEEASEFLRDKIEGENVVLEFGKEKRDHYGRILAYVKYKGENVNIDLVEEGYANYYFPEGKDRYYGEFVRAWESCLEKGVRRCKPSDDVCSDCLELESFNHDDGRVVFENTCRRSCNLEGWEMEDEGSKKFFFGDLVLGPGENVLVVSGDGSASGSFDEVVEWDEHSYVWTYTGDTLFLRDAEGDLVLWEGY